MRIGVTGIFASGKGTVCRFFKDLGAEIIDTDIIAREIVKPQSKGWKKIKEIFGDKFIASDGYLKRRELANFIFNDPARVEQLNKITHPLILENILERTSCASRGFFMINTPLLFEAKFNTYMDKNIVVYAKEDQVIKRGEERDQISSQEIKDRLNFQISLSEKVKLADYVIDNSKTFENTKRQVLDLWNILKKI